MLSRSLLVATCFSLSTWWLSFLVEENGKRDLHFLLCAGEEGGRHGRGEDEVDSLDCDEEPDPLDLMNSCERKVSRA